MQAPARPDCARLREAGVAAALPVEPRVILYHKQSASARTRFLRHAHDSIFAVEGLPGEALLCKDRIAWHPAATIADIEQRFAMERGSLEVQGRFAATVLTPQARVPVFLARFTSIDPPFYLADWLEGRFVDLTQARDLPAIELQLLRTAYELVMGG
jgi:hypothetical protein